MFHAALVRARFARAVFACFMVGGLGGCYRVGPGGAGVPATVTPPEAAKFSAMSGSLTSKGVVTQAVTNAYTHEAALTVAKSAEIQTQARSPDPATNLQHVDVTAVGYGYFGTDAGKIESNGSSLRGTVVNSPDTWATFTNTPGARLDASLGAPSLENSYVGVGSLGKRAAGSTGDFFSYAFAVFGGKSTSDMPTSGKAEYQGAFEGLEQVAPVGSAMQTNSISGKANLTADFAAATVNGRIDDVNNHGLGPIATPSPYSIGYSGAIKDAGFAGSSWLTQKNSNAPLNGFSQNSGALEGGFFGPGAAEVAGVIGVSAADANKKMLVTGGFGATKK